MTSTMMIFATIMSLLSLMMLPAVHSQDYFADFEQQMLGQQSIEATKKLSSDFMGTTDSPKEIEILCAGNPLVTIKDLVTDTANAFDGGECLVIKLKGDNFAFRLSMNCDETEKSEFNFDIGN